MHILFLFVFQNPNINIRIIGATAKYPYSGSASIVKFLNLNFIDPLSNLATANPGASVPDTNNLLLAFGLVINAVTTKPFPYSPFMANLTV